MFLSKHNHFIYDDIGWLAHLAQQMGMILGKHKSYSLFQNQLNVFKSTTNKNKISRLEEMLNWEHPVDQLGRRLSDTGAK